MTEDKTSGGEDLSRQQEAEVAGIDAVIPMVADDATDVRQALLGLPEVEPPRDLWPEVLAGLPKRTPWYQRAPLALAASVFLAAVASVVLLQSQPEPTAEWASLMDRSQQLETQVLSNGVPSARWNTTQRSLAYRIADVDQQLNDSSGLAAPASANEDETVALLQQRVELLETLLAEELARRDAHVY